jgi:uncharacterized protein (TIGR02145 family)
MTLYFNNTYFHRAFVFIFFQLTISCESEIKKLKTLDSDPIETIAQKENCLQGRWMQEGKESDLSYWELEVRKNDAANEWGFVGTFTINHFDKDGRKLVNIHGSESNTGIWRIINNRVEMRTMGYPEFKRFFDFSHCNRITTQNIIFVKIESYDSLTYIAIRAREEAERMEAEKNDSINKINMLKQEINNINFDNDTATNGVIIGFQIWMTKNLNVDTFRNGDPIPQAKTKDEWNRALENKDPAWCFADFNPINGAKYGKLYNWYAVKDYRHIAPNGWHIPGDEEWLQLLDYLGGTFMAVEALKNTSGWVSCLDGKPKNGTNSSGFSALPGDEMPRSLYCKFSESSANWWTSTLNQSFENNSPVVIGMMDVVSIISTSDGSIKEGYSVRCVKD